MPEIDLRARAAGSVPAVGADDLRRVWSMVDSQRREGPAHSAISLSLVAGQCARDADPLAVWLRVTLVDALLQQGRLDAWRDGNGPQEKVFQIAASFPLPKGPSEADIEAFLAAMQ